MTQGAFDILITKLFLHMSPVNRKSLSHCLTLLRNRFTFLMYSIKMFMNLWQNN